MKRVEREGESEGYGKDKEEGERERGRRGGREGGRVKSMMCRLKENLWARQIRGRK